MISFDIYGSSTCNLAPFANHLFNFFHFFFTDYTELSTSVLTQV